LSTTLKQLKLRLLNHAGYRFHKSTSVLGFPYLIKLNDNFSQSQYLSPYDNIPEIISCAAYCRTQGRSVVLDVGAHSGFFATQLNQLLRNQPGEVELYSFEPTAPTFTDLFQHLGGVPHSDSIRIIPVALSDTKEWVSISYEEKDSMLAQIIPKSGDARLKGPTYIGASMTLDSFVSKFSISPVVLKIDVEGFEMNVLLGAQKTLTDNLPAICIEWNPETAKQTGTDMAGLANLLRDYEIYYLNDYQGQRLPFTSLVSDPLEISWTSNLFCLPVSKNSAGEWKKHLNAIIKDYRLALKVC
jgi:FkbM family methyltransferase